MHSPHDLACLNRVLASLIRIVSSSGGYSVDCHLTCGCHGFAPGCMGRIGLLAVDGKAGVSLIVLIVSEFVLVVMMAGRQLGVGATCTFDVSGLVVVVIVGVVSELIAPTNVWLGWSSVGSQCAVVVGCNVCEVTADAANTVGLEDKHTTLLSDSPSTRLLEINTVLL